jgi:hypothetical protein
MSLEANSYSLLAFSLFALLLADVVSDAYLIALRYSSPSSAQNRWQASMKLSSEPMISGQPSDVEALFSSTDGYCSLVYSA